MANGLYDMERRIRRAGVEYRRIVERWSGALADRDHPACTPAWICAPEPALPEGACMP
jgi:hypothetical protein